MPIVLLQDVQYGIQIDGLQRASVQVVRFMSNHELARTVFLVNQVRVRLDRAQAEAEGQVLPDALFAAQRDSSIKQK